MAVPRVRPSLTLTGKQAERLVVDLAHVLGWRVAHFRPAKTPQGWRTPVAADGKGFPDFVLVHAKRQRIIYAELKTGTGRLTDEQRAWLEALRSAGGEAYLWRYPDDWDDIVRTLQGAER